MAERWSNKRLTQEQFVSRAREIWGEQYDYSESVYIAGMKPITVRCRKHDHFFTVIAGNHISRSLRSPNGCPLCGKERKDASIASQRKPKSPKGLKPTPQDLFIERMKARYGDTYDYSKVFYCGRDTPVTFTCPQHGDFSLSPHALLCGVHGVQPHGCPKCAGLRLNAPKQKKQKKERLPFDFLSAAREVHGDRYEYPIIPTHQYENGKPVKIPIVCKTHGTFQQRVDLHLSGCGCPVCANRHIPLEVRYSRPRTIWR